MVTGTVDVIAPRAIILPQRLTHIISGAYGELCISGANLYYMNNAGVWQGLEISGALQQTLP